LKSKHQITQAAELDSLPKFREHIKGICKKLSGIDDAQCYDIQLAVDEACTNIITHGYEDMEPGSIILRLDPSEKGVAITITDFGHPFEPYETDMPDSEAGLEDMPVGGFGLFFIYQTMDEVDYKTKEDGNHLKLIKYI